MISKEQYRNFLLQQMKQKEMRKQLQKMQNRSSSSRQKSPSILTSAKLLVSQLAQQPVQPVQPQAYVEQHAIQAPVNPVPITSHVTPKQHHMGFSKQLDIKLATPISPLTESQAIQHVLSSIHHNNSHLLTPVSSPTSLPVQQIYQQGARNLLKLQNQPTQQIESRHSRRLQLQKQLKQEMEELEKRKREERERKIQQEREEIRKQERYKEELMRRDREMETKRQSRINRQEVYEGDNKGEGEQEIIREKLQKKRSRGDEDSSNNTEENMMSFKQFKARQNLSKHKHLKHKQPKSHNPLPQLQPHPTRIHSSQHPSRPSRFPSSSSQPHRLHKPTITQSQQDSQQTAKKQEYLILEDMISQVRRQIKAQEVEFKREIEKARKQAVKAVEEKRRLEEEFGKLRRQLYRAGSKQKEQESEVNSEEEDFYDARKFSSQSHRRRPLPQPQYPSRNQYQFPRHSSQYVQPLRPTKKQRLVHREYGQYPSHIPNNPNPSTYQNPFQDSGMQSLACQSKKIPIVLNSKLQKLTMSGIEDYAIDNKKPSPSKFARKQNRLEQSSMQFNEFLQNPLVIGGGNELIDFNLSAMNSEESRVRAVGESRLRKKEFKLKRQQHQQQQQQGDSDRNDKSYFFSGQDDSSMQRDKIKSQQVKYRKWRPDHPDREQ